MSRQDLDAARAYWRERLAGITEATSLGIEHATGDEGPGEALVPLSAEVAGTGLTEFARRHRHSLRTPSFRPPGPPSCPCTPAATTSCSASPRR
ncbi:hypothetical protein, partial [Streptomyces sp. OR43]|uniref:hypothetical protein n=1 Tax=Streptomyces sp. or43 TaxID=2478957 RepID=UPI0021C73D56